MDVALSEGLVALARSGGAPVPGDLDLGALADRRPDREVVACRVAHGQCIESAMRRERVAADEVLAAIRHSGGLAYADAEAVLLESDGLLTAILKPQS